MKYAVIKALSKETELPQEQISKLVEVPPNHELGDYSFPCFVLSKKLKKSPAEIASELASKIKSKAFEKIEAKGPYINFFLDRISLAKETLNKILKEKDNYGKQKTNSKVLIESPGPNTNKPLHIGHARNIILAQSLKKILEFSGNNVKIVNINNDRGIHICKSLVAYKKFGRGITPEKAKRKSDFFVGDFYVRYNKEAKKNPELEEEIKQCLQKWESGDKETLSLWKKMNTWAYTGFRETYKKFGLEIDKEYYESEIYKKGKDLIFEQFKKGNVQKKPDGAYFINLGRELGEKVLIRSDGTSIYITFDLSLAILRKKEFDFDKMIYIVANEQDYHFKVLFKLLEIFGYKWSNSLYHLSYGLVHLESGRMKSREGSVIDADELIKELENLAEKELTKRYPSLSKGEKAKRIKAISMSALRYYFLKIDKIKDILFIPEHSISFDGNTGPYMLYTYARARSILKKARYKPANLDIKSLGQEEKNLLLLLQEFPEIVEKAYNSLAPNIISNYVHQLAKSFNEFYHAHKVINSSSEKFRLSLVDASSQVLKNALALLHIDTLEEM